MILDGNLVFDTNVAITSTAASTNIIDLLNARDMGAGDGGNDTIKILSQVTTTLATANGATINVQIQGAPDNGSGAPGSYTTMAESGVLPAAGLVQGARLFDISLPRPVPNQARPRFLRMNYVVGTGAFTAGNLTSALVLSRDEIPQGAAGFNSGYPAGITVSN